MDASAVAAALSVALSVCGSSATLSRDAGWLRGRGLARKVGGAAFRADPLLPHPQSARPARRRARRRLRLRAPRAARLRARRRLGLWAPRRLRLRAPRRLRAGRRRLWRRARRRLWRRARRRLRLRARSASASASGSSSCSASGSSSSAEPLDECPWTSSRTKRPPGPVAIRPAVTSPAPMANARHGDRPFFSGATSPSAASAAARATLRRSTAIVRPPYRHTSLRRSWLPGRSNQ